MRLTPLLASAAVLALAGSTLSQAQTPGQPATAGAPVEVEIDQGVLRPFQIAVVPFTGERGRDISDVVLSLIHI